MWSALFWDITQRIVVIPYRRIGTKYRYGITTVGVPRQAEIFQGVPGRLKPRIFLTFGTTRVVGRQPYTPAAFTSGETPGTHFQRLSWPQGTWFCRAEARKNSPLTPPGIDPRTVRLVAQRLNHYATQGPGITTIRYVFSQKSADLFHFAAEAWDHA